MLIEFSVENYRSFRERATLSLIATKLKSVVPAIDEENVITVDAKLSLLRSAVIYGANASGKSNLYKAFRFFRKFVRDSATGSHSDDPIPAQPFLLDRAARNAPSVFELVFMFDGRQHRYGFSVTADRVIEEWLYLVPTTREAMAFERTGDDVRLGTSFRSARDVPARTRPNALFLSVAAQLNVDIAVRLVRFLSRQFACITTLDDSSYMDFTARSIESGKFARRIAEYAAHIDPAIVGLSIEADAASGRRRLMSHRLVRDDGAEGVDEQAFDFMAMESEGTKKAIALAGPLFDALDRGMVVFVDELDARLHPLVTRELLSVFNSQRTNPNNAQLIAITHDTNLLDNRHLRRDQIYFTEKDRRDATHLYSLAEFKVPHGSGNRTPRNDSSYESDYILGRYGAVPYLGDAGRLFGDRSGQTGEAGAGAPDTSSGR